MAQLPLPGELGARRHTQLVDEWEQVLQFRGGEAGEFFGGQQDAQPIGVAHEPSFAVSGNEPSPTPPENARWIPGATRRSSLMTP